MEKNVLKIFIIFVFLYITEIININAKRANSYLQDKDNPYKRELIYKYLFSPSFVYFMIKYNPHRTAESAYNIEYE